jgi:hypothetical protein
VSAIDTSQPVDSAPVADGGRRIRETRQWMLDAWIAFAARYQDGSTPNDPGTSNGGFKVPTTAPGVPTVGDFYITTTGLVYSYKTGPTQQLCGDFASGTIATFLQATAPVGWVREATGQTSSFLRYVTGALSAGGTSDPSAIVHPAPPGFDGNSPGGLPRLFYNDGATNHPITNHTLSFRDVIQATK